MTLNYGLLNYGWTADDNTDRETEKYTFVYILYVRNSLRSAATKTCQHNVVFYVVMINIYSKDTFTIVIIV